MPPTLFAPTCIQCLPVSFKGRLVSIGKLTPTISDKKIYNLNKETNIGDCKDMDQNPSSSSSFASVCFALKRLCEVEARFLLSWKKGPGQRICSSYIIALVEDTIGTFYKNG